MAIVNTKVGDFKLSEAFAIGLTKSLSEQLLSQFIGNGSYMSGAVKLGLAWAVPKYLMKGGFGKTVGTALAVDGTEDIINNLFKGGANVSASSHGLI